MSKQWILGKKAGYVVLEVSERKRAFKKSGSCNLSSQQHIESHVAIFCCTCGKKTELSGNSIFESSHIHFYFSRYYEHLSLKPVEQCFNAPVCEFYDLFFASLVQICMS